MAPLTALFIVEREPVALHMQRTLDPSKERILVCAYSTSLMGLRVETIYLRLPTKEWLEQSEARAKTFEDWIESSVRCRLVPGGQLIII